MWSPVGPHVQWNLSDVVTYGNSLSGWIKTGEYIFEIEMYGMTET